MARDANDITKKTLTNVILKLRNDTLANWNNSTYQLAKGELAIAIGDVSNPIIRVGDGTKTWSQLTNAGSVITEADAYTAANGGKDRTHGAIKVNDANIQTFELTIADATTIGAVLSTTLETSASNAGYAHINNEYLPGYATVENDGRIRVKVVADAEKLYNPRTITFAESAANAGDTDATGSFTFDGSANVTTQLTLVDKHAFTAAETSQGYARVTVAHVDAKGRVIDDEAFVSSDVSDAINAGAADDADATAKAAKAAKVVITDADGKVADTFLHTTGITANTAAADAYYTGVKVDVKGRVVEAISSDDFKATDKNTSVANAKTSTLGYVTSDFDENEAANSDNNKGKVAIDANANMTVTRVEEADKFHTARTITVEAQNSGATRSDVTGSVSFDGSQDVSFALQLNDQANVTPNNETGYQRTTVNRVNKQGLVVGSEQLVSNDVSDAIAIGAADDADASAKAAKAAKVVITDSDGKLADTFLHAVTRTDTDQVNTSTAVVASITTDAKGRVTATSTIEATTTGGTSADAGKLVKLTAEGLLDNTLIPNLAIGQIQQVAYSDSETVGQNGVIAFKGIDTNVQSGDKFVA